MDDMRRNLVDLNCRAAASRSRSAGGARSGGRGRVRRRPGAQHPLPQSAGRAVVRHRTPRMPSASSAATCSSPAAARIARHASLRHHRLPDPARAPGRQRAGGRAAADALRQPPDRDHQLARRQRPAGAGDARRDRARGRAPRARHGARQRLPRIPHAARGAARVHRAAARRAEDRARRRSSRSWCCRWSAARCGSRGSSTTCSRACASNPDSSTCAARASSSATWSRTRAGWSMRCCASAASRSRSTCPRASTLQGDATRLTQVFVNLIANASKFAPEGTPIRVGARRGRQQVSAWVEDAGPGPSRGRRASASSSASSAAAAGAGAGRPGAGAVDLAFHCRTPRRQHHRGAHRRGLHALHDRRCPNPEPDA